MSRALVIGVVALVLLGGAAAAGYAVGSSTAPDAGDARASWRDASHLAYGPALADARTRSRATGRTRGVARGRVTGRREGAQAGRSAGDVAAGKELAANEAQAAAATPSTSGLTYVPRLPSGQPGYALPPEQRTLSCVGFDAQTGECVGD